MLNEKVAVKKKDVFGGIGTVKWGNWQMRMVEKDQR